MSFIDEMLPIEHDDPINAKILAVSEDKIEGFVREPSWKWRSVPSSRRSGHGEDRGHVGAGTIRRVRQTLLATNLADGALVAWKVLPEKIDAAFDWMFQCDPFSGHVVLRSTETATAGSDYKLWTTVKVPHGHSLQEHCAISRAESRGGTFSHYAGERNLHIRCRSCSPKNDGARKQSGQAAQISPVQAVALTAREWEVLLALKREFDPGEIRVDAMGMRVRAKPVFRWRSFMTWPKALNARKVIGRFSTFLEHVKPSATGVRVTRFNGLFHWAVPPGREIEAGGEVGRHHILTHCYWREGGPEFKNVNIMAVAHGTEKPLLLEHKAAIDRHLARSECRFSYTNVFWGGRSEIKPSEISPRIYREWRQSENRRERIKVSMQRCSRKRSRRAST